MPPTTDPDARLHKKSGKISSRIAARMVMRDHDDMAVIIRTQGLLDELGAR